MNDKRALYLELPAAEYDALVAVAKAEERTLVATVRRALRPLLAPDQAAA